MLLIGIIYLIRYNYVAKEKVLNPIATYVKINRLEAGLTQKEFALRSGLGLRFVRDLE